VPNISFGFPVIAAVKQVAQKPLDVHLMIMDPDPYLPGFRQVGADILTVHQEACPHLDRTVRLIRDEIGIKVGVAINPATPLHTLEHLLPLIDVVNLMTVNPGFGGQRLIDYSYEKIRQLKAMIQARELSTLIEIDGGVNLENAPKLLTAGADVLVAGSFVFRAEDPLHTIAELKHLQVSPDPTA
jgi:ribulose-phosphate 3-epimerase